MGEARVAQVDAVPKASRVERYAPPGSADLRPGEAIFRLLVAIKPRDADTENFFEDFSGKRRDGCEVVKACSDVRERVGETLFFR